MRKIALGTAQALGLLVLLVTLTPVTSWWGRLLAGKVAEPRGDAMIVLAGSDLGGFIGPDTYWRCIYAVRAFRAGHFERVYVSGGPNLDEPVAFEMKRMLVLNGVPADRIIEESASHSTRENALFLKPLLARESRPPLLITSDLHTFRARRVFARLGVPVECRAAPDAMKRGTRYEDRWSVFVDLSVESVRIAYYFARGWI